VRLRVRTMLWGLMPLAFALGMARYGLVTYLGIYDPQISLLSVGQRVAISDETGRPIRVATADDADVSLVAGTKAVVTHESAWDQDSCYPRREIGVIVDGGPYSGLRVTVTRENLRPRR
jgi:hypothetical protein